MYVVEKKLSFMIYVMCGDLVLKNEDTTITIICKMGCVTYSRAELK